MQHAPRGSRRLPALAIGALVGAVAMLAVGSSASAAKKSASTKAHGSAGLSITSQAWGTVNGSTVKLYTLKNGNGMKVKITNYGGVVQSIWVPDRAGRLVNVALGFSSLSDYVERLHSGRDQHPVAAGGWVRRHVLRRDHRPLRESDRQRLLQRSTARPTSSTPTTARTRCTAAIWAGTRRSGRRVPRGRPARCR